LSNEKIVGFIPASIKLTKILIELKIPIDIVQKTSDKVNYDRYLIKSGSGNKMNFKCVSKQKYFKSLKKNSLPTTSIFIDYESWFYSLKLHYHERPDLTNFFDDINNFGTIKHIFFFGNFTEEMKGELVKIRKFTNNIIECYGHETKEYSDVIMLDYIYRYVIDFPQIEQYVVFTNDGHFLPMINTLQNNFGKKVITTGIQHQVNLLLYSASKHHLSIIPNLLKDVEKYWSDILKGMLYSENKGKLLTYTSTLDHTIRRGLEENIAYAALQKLIDEEYIDFEEVDISGRKMSVMYPNWAKLKKDEVFDFESVPVNNGFRKRPV